MKMISMVLPINFPVLIFIQNYSLQVEMFSNLWRLCTIRLIPQVTRRQFLTSDQFPFDVLYPSFWSVSFINKLLNFWLIINLTILFNTGLVIDIVKLLLLSNSQLILKFSLAPLLFNLFVYDLSEKLVYCKYHKFTNDFKLHLLGPLSFLPDLFTKMRTWISIWFQIG